MPVTVKTSPVATTGDAKKGTAMNNRPNRRNASEDRTDARMRNAHNPRLGRKDRRAPEMRAPHRVVSLATVARYAFAVLIVLAVIKALAS